jgi:hypothetical protein
MSASAVVFRRDTTQSQDDDWVRRRIQNWHFFEFEYDTIEEKLFNERRTTPKTATQQYLDILEVWNAIADAGGFDPCYLFSQEQYFIDTRNKTNAKPI